MEIGRKSVLNFCLLMIALYQKEKSPLHNRRRLMKNTQNLFIGTSVIKGFYANLLPFNLHPSNPHSTQLSPGLTNDILTSVLPQIDRSLNRNLIISNVPLNPMNWHILIPFNRAL